MNKRLLTMAMAVVFGVGTSLAFEADEYIYTKDAKLKVSTGTNLVTNGNYSQEDGWTNENGGPLAANWLVKTVAGPQGSEVTAVTSNGAAADEGTVLQNRWALKTGIYAISYYAYSPTAVATTTTSGGNNFVSFFISADGTTVDRQVNEVANLAEMGWTLVTDTLQVNTEEEILYLNLKQVAEGIQFTDFQIVECEEVYDTRIAEKRVEFAEAILNDPNFNLESAEDEYDDLSAMIKNIKTMIATNKMESQSTAESAMNNLEKRLEAYMDASTENLASNTYFNYIEDFEAMANYNRGNISDGQQIGGFIFRGYNWQHGSYRGEGNAIIAGPNGKTGLPYIMKQIQGTSSNPCGPGSVGMRNTKLPAGKYYVAADMYNAKCLNNYALTYDLETAVAGFVGSDTVQLGTIAGEGYVKKYFVAELKEGEELEAGFYWYNDFEYGARWELTNFEIRRFGTGVADYVAHQEAWTTFKAQYDAAVSGRDKVLAMQEDKAHYPWAQDSLANALAQWDPYFNALQAKGWVTEDGKDAGVATTDELTDWAKYQGVEMYNDEGELLDFQVVRGYQNATNYVIAQNQPLADLVDAIENAKIVRDDAMNVNGDKETFQGVIDMATIVLSMMAHTSDATRAADEPQVNSAINMLAAAQEAFLKSAELKPIVDIDFSNAFEAVEEEGATVGYVVKGAVGQMEFGTGVTLDSTTGDNNYQIGYNEAVVGALRVGNTVSTVNLGEANIPTDDDVLRFTFDLWPGKLVGKNLTIELQNADGVRVAGFTYEVYNNIQTNNDFDNDAHEGLNLTKCSYSGNSNNEAIFVDACKSSIELIVDYKGQTLQGILTKQNVTYTGALMPIPAVDNNKIAKFTLTSNYNNNGRRCWFDNLKVFKYASSAEGPVDLGVKDIAVEKADTDAIYTLSGVRVSNMSKPGLYIVNGKKVIVK